jgi:hypothetical protein
MRGRPDLLLAEIEDRVHDVLALEILRDVDVLPLHYLLRQYRRLDVTS